VVFFFGCWAKTPPTAKNKRHASAHRNQRLR
jgi:hypothetical protein